MSAVCEIALPVPSLSTWSGANLRSPLASDRPKARQEQPRVLVIDSKNGIRELLSLYLGSRGLEVATAQSGVEAKAVVERGQFDLVILGWVLEGVEGPDLLRLCKARHPDGGVIIFTGADLDQPGIDGILARGADAVVRRQESLGALFTAICQSLEPRRLLPLNAA